MNKDDLDKIQRLEDLVSEFCDHQLKWSSVLPGEKEPEYTKRVLAPQFQEFIKEIGDRQVSWSCDGTSERPHPVTIGFGQSFYPDIAIDIFGRRTIAFEVKFLGEHSYSGRLSTAVGQAVIYSSFGYRFSHALLVSETGARIHIASDLAHLNSTLARQGISFHVLGNE